MGQQLVKSFIKKPSFLKPDVFTSSVYYICNESVLSLQVASHKKDAGKWGVPAGKIETQESPLLAAIRELKEETSISADALIHSDTIFFHLSHFYSLNNHLSYEYNMFVTHLPEKPPVTLSLEHQATNG